jgi:DNA processing protein
VSQSQLIIVLSHHGLTFHRYQTIIEKYGVLSYDILINNIAEKEFSWLTLALDFLPLELASTEELHSKYGIFMLTLIDEKYPKCLQEIYDSPLVLYYKGDISLLQHYSSCLTVIGSRNNSKYSEMVMEKILPNCIKQGLIVVSGLAEGVDGLAHKTALAGKGKTIAVIGSGLNDESFYPKSNSQLYAHIIDQGGLVLSEYPIGTEPKTFHFPQRNRMLAALSPITWVVEASIKSGSMTTVKFAKKYGKKVLTNPGNLFVDQCSGNIELMKQGVACVFDSSDIVSLYDNITELPSKTGFKHSIFAYFTTSIMTIDELLVSSKSSFSQLNSELSMAELDGAVIHLGENIWQKNFL